MSIISFLRKIVRQEKSIPITIVKVSKTEDKPLDTANPVVRSMRSLRLMSNFSTHLTPKQSYRVGIMGYHVSSVEATIPRTLLSPIIRFSDPWWKGE